jgi:hypothetical protein
MLVYSVIGFQDFTPKIHISEEDFAVITENGDLLDQEGQVIFSSLEMSRANLWIEHAVQIS